MAPVTQPPTENRDLSVPFRMSKVVLPSMDRAERKVYERKIWLATLMFTPASRRDSLVAMATVFGLVGLGIAILVLRF